MVHFDAHCTQRLTVTLTYQPIYRARAECISAYACQGRVIHGVRDQLTALTDIPHVKGHRARLLFEAGLRSPELIASAKLDHLAAIIAKGAL